MAWQFIREGAACLVWNNLSGVARAVGVSARRQKAVADAAKGGGMGLGLMAGGLAAAASNDDAQGAAVDVVEDVADLAKDVGQAVAATAEDAVEAAKDVAEDVAEAAKDLGGKAVATAGEVAEGVAEAAKDLGDKVVDLVDEKPAAE